MGHTRDPPQLVLWMCTLSMMLMMSMMSLLMMLSLSRCQGIRGGNNAVLGTNVDYAATWLGMAGIPTPATFDGRSILSQLVSAPARPCVLMEHPNL